MAILVRTIEQTVLSATLENLDPWRNMRVSRHREVVSELWKPIMQRLMILRHAKAVPWYSGVDDFCRPLSDMGTEHALKVANWMCEQLEEPDSILCSPSQRTRETLAPLLLQTPGLESVTRFEPEIYGASISTLHSFLDFDFTEADRVLIVGHNPGFEMLVFDVIARSQYDKITRLATGTLVVVDFESGWATGSGEGVLCHKIRGKKL